MKQKIWEAPFPKGTNVNLRATAVELDDRGVVLAIGLTQIAISWPEFESINGDTLGARLPQTERDLKHHRMMIAGRLVLVVGLVDEEKRDDAAYVVVYDIESGQNIVISRYQLDDGIDLGDVRTLPMPPRDQVDNEGDDSAPPEPEEDQAPQGEAGKEE